MFSAVYLECDGGGAWLRLVAAEGDPLLLEALLVLEVVLHVGEDHVASRDVHLGRSVRGRVLATGVAANMKSQVDQRPFVGYAFVPVVIFHFLNRSGNLQTGQMTGHDRSGTSRLKSNVLS